MFYTVMDDGRGTDRDRDIGIGTGGSHECDWDGVTCDGEGKVKVLAFPASAMEFNEDLLSGQMARWK